MYAVVDNYKEAQENAIRRYAELAFSDLPYTRIIIYNDLQWMRYSIEVRQEERVLATSHINYEHMHLGPDVITRLVLNTIRK